MMFHSLRISNTVSIVLIKQIELMADKEKKHPTFVRASNSLVTYTSQIYCDR